MTIQKIISRRFLLNALALLPFINIAQAKPKVVYLNVILYNYLDRPIFDVYIDGKVGFGSEAYPATGGGIVVGVPFEIGPKIVSWRLDGPANTPRNGEKVTNKNVLTLDWVPGGKYLNVHIYPDDTVKLIVSTSIPIKMLPPV